MDSTRPDYWERLQELFSRVQKLTEAERAEFLKQELSGENAELQSQLQRMLRIADDGAEIEHPNAFAALFDQMVQQTAEADSTDGQNQVLPQDEDAESEPFQRLDRYCIDQVLGKGGFGVVYLAYDEQLDRRVAVKVPHAKLVSRPEDAEAYLAEARTVANLDHPNIVPVYDVGSTTDCPCYIVSKYIEGANLATKIKNGRLNFTETAKLVVEVAEALHYAHKQGLVHRDVKPGNILLDGDGKPHVVDFGLALKDENIGKGSKYAGTPPYMSPEQARGEGHRVDGRSDIFSLGVVFYESLVGRRPFRGDTQADVLERITNHEAKPLRQIDDRIPKELERICLKALSKRESERYTTAVDMAEDLRRFLAEKASAEAVIKSGAAISTGPDSNELSEVHQESESHLRFFEGRKQLLGEIADWIDCSDAGGYLLVLGPPGIGKSALMSQLSRRYQDDDLCILHMIKSHRNPLRFLPSLTAQATRLACEAFPMSTVDGDIDDLRNTLVKALQKLAARKGKAILLLDALDEIDPQHRSLSFLPRHMPRGVRAIVTCRPDVPLVQTLRRHVGQLNEITCPPLSEVDLMSVADKRLDADVFRCLRGQAEWNTLVNRLGGNPLLFQYVLERISNTVNNPVKAEQSQSLNLEQIPSTWDEIFAEIYEEITEKKDGKRDSTSGRQRSDLLKVLSVACEPLSADQICQLMAAAGHHLSLEECQDHLLAMSEYLLQLGDHRFKPWHQGLTDYVCGKILGDSGCRQVEELFCEWLRQPQAKESGYHWLHRVSHLIAAGNILECKQILTDLQYVATKCKAEGIFELLMDYDRYRATTEDMDQSASVVRHYMRDISKGRLTRPPSTHPVVSAMRRRPKSRRNTASNDLDVDDDVEVFTGFLAQYSHRLIGHPECTITLARNYASSGPVVKQAEKLCEDAQDIWISADPRPQLRLSSCVLTIQAEPYETEVAISADGKFISSRGGGLLGSARVATWNATSGEEQSSILVEDLFPGEDCYLLMGGPALTMHERITQCPADVWKLVRKQSSSEQPYRDPIVSLTADGKYMVVQYFADFPTGEKETLSYLELEDLREFHEEWLDARIMDDPQPKTAFRPLGENHDDLDLPVCFDSRQLSERQRKLWQFENVDWETGEIEHFRRTTVIECIDIDECKSRYLLESSYVASGSSVGIALDAHLGVFLAGGSPILFDSSSGRVEQGPFIHDNFALGVALTPDGCIAASVGQEPFLRVWRVETGEEICCIRDGRGECLAITPNGEVVVAGHDDGRLSVWHTMSGDLLAEFSTDQSGVCSVDISADGRKVVSAAGNIIQVWDLSRSRRPTPTCNGGRVTRGMSLSDDGQFALSFTPSYDGSLTFWDVASQKPVQVLEHKEWMDLSRAASDDPSFARAAETFRSTFSQWADLTGLFPIVAASVDQYDGTFHVVNLQTGKEEISISIKNDDANWRWWGGDQILLSDDRKFVIVCKDGSLRVLDLASGEMVHELNPSSRTHSTDTSGRFVVSIDDDILSVWNLESGRKECVLTLPEGGFDRTVSVELHPNGRWLVIACHTLIRVWDSRAKELVATHFTESTVSCMSPIRGEDRFLIGTEDGEIQFLRLRNLEWN